MKKLMLAILSVFLVAPVFSNIFPEAPLKIEVGAAPGGGMDIVARRLSGILAKNLDQPVMVNNQPGGGGSNALMKLKHVAADGYTMALVPSFALSYQPLISDQYSLDNFIVIASLYHSPDAFIVKGDAPWQSLLEMFDNGRTQDKTLLFASQSPVDKLIVSYLARGTNTKIAALPTKGGGEMIPKLLGGHVDFAYSATMHTQYLSSNKMRVLASLTKERQVTSPDAPTLRELGWDIALNTKFLIVVPKGVPDEIINKLSTLLEGAMQTSDMKDLVEDKLFMQIDVRKGQDVEEFIANEQKIMSKMIEALK